MCEWITIVAVKDNFDGMEGEADQLNFIDNILITQSSLQAKDIIRRYY